MTKGKRPIHAERLRLAQAERRRTRPAPPTPTFEDLWGSVLTPGATPKRKTHPKTWKYRPEHKATTKKGRAA